MFGKPKKRDQSYLTQRAPKLYGDLRPKPRNWLPLKIGLGVTLGVMGLTWIGYWLLFSTQFKVAKVEVVGAVLSDPEAISALIPTSGSIWHLPESEVVAKVMERYPMQSVQVSRGLPSTVRVRLVERQPVLVWHSVNLLSLLDDQGQVILQYPEQTTHGPETAVGQLISQLPHIDDQANLAVQPGKLVVSASFILFVQNLVTSMQQYLPQVKLDHLAVLDTTYDLTLFSPTGLTVQFSTVSLAEVQVRNLARLLLEKKASFNSSVDLRIDHWSYVK